jgi:holo-[acyl-carrier protein] synthase
MESERVAALRRAYEAAREGDLSGVIASGLLDPDIEWRPLAGEGEVEYGHDGVARAQSRWLEAWEGYWIEPEEFIEAGDHVVVMVREGGRGSGSGVQLERRYAHLIGFREGRVVLFHALPTPEAALEAARSERPKRNEHERPTGEAAAAGRVGIDLLEVERLERALARQPRLAERLFTDAERAYADARARPVRHLAARFCAKEAVAKALGLAAWSFRDVEAADRARELGVVPVVSLTHTDTTAGAVALLT